MQVAEIIGDEFFNPNTQELVNVNGVPIKMILINIYAPTDFNLGRPDVFNSEDPGTLNNALAPAVPPNNTIPYQFIGADTEDVGPLPLDAEGEVDILQVIADREAGETHAFNYFRLGELSFTEQPESEFQRRIVIANGSTRELLFSLTPTGTGPEVQGQILAELDTLIDGINSVQFVAAEPVTIEITDLEMTGNGMTVKFSSDPGLSGFSIWTAPTLDATFSNELKENSVITEVAPGEYEAVVTDAEFPSGLFMCVQLD